MNKKVAEKIDEIHTQAMYLAEKAILAGIRNPSASPNSMNQRAFELESEAAELAYTHGMEEPSRTILLESAAQFAILLGHYPKALDFVAKGISGNPPKELRRELVLEVLYVIYEDLKGEYYQ